MIGKKEPDARKLLDSSTAVLLGAIRVSMSALRPVAAQNASMVAQQSDYNFTWVTRTRQETIAFDDLLEFHRRLVEAGWRTTNDCWVSE